MARALPPHFDSESKWGTYLPSKGSAFALKIAHRLPHVLISVTRMLRRHIKYGLNSPLDLVIWGLRLRVLPRGNIAEEKLYSAPQLFDEVEFASMRSRLGPGSVFVDIGANAGAYSFWAHHCQNGKGRILAFEPDPEMQRRLTYNITTNALNIELLPYALSDHEGVAEFYINPQQRGTNSLLSDRKRATSIATQVQMTTLCKALATKQVTAIDVLKIDIEGHEIPVLTHFFSNAPRSLLPLAVITEFNADNKNELANLFENNGYVLSKQAKLNLIFTRG